MRRWVLLAALAFSAAVHAFLAPEHLHEEPLLGALFVVGAILEAGLVVLLGSRPTRAAVAAASAVLGGVLVAYLPFVLFHLPGFPMTPEPLEQVALVTKSVELAGLALGASLLARPAPLRRQLAAAGTSVLAALVAAAWAAPPSFGDDGGGAQRSVDIAGALFAPDVLHVLVGDTVTWTNDDHMSHTVTADEFDSGLLQPGGRFSFTFTQPGVYRYHCTIHRFMQGEIDAAAVALVGPAESVPLGSTVTLSGLARAGTVELEQEQPDGSYVRVAAAEPAGDGSFTFPVVASGPTRLRVRAGDELSEPVAVAPRPHVTIAAVRRGGRARVTISVSPDQAGAPVELERYIRERYLWLPVRRAPVGGDGRVTVSVPAAAGAVRLRAHLLRGRNGWGDAASAPVVLR